MHNIVDLELKFIEAKSLLSTIRLAVERIDAETLNDSGISICIDMVERLRSECHTRVMDSAKQFNFTDPA